MLYHGNQCWFIIIVISHSACIEIHVTNSIYKKKLQILQGYIDGLVQDCGISAVLCCAIYVSQ